MVNIYFLKVQSLILEYSWPSFYLIFFWHFGIYGLWCSFIWWSWANFLPSLCYFHFSVFNQKTLYNAYKKRTKNVAVDLDEYSKMKEADPEFYREASSLQYGKVGASAMISSFVFHLFQTSAKGFPTLLSSNCTGTKIVRGQDREDGEGAQG